MESARHQHHAGARPDRVARLAREGTFFSRGVAIPGRGLGGIDRHPPGSRPRRHRQDEGDRLGVGIEHQVEVGPVLAADQARQASRESDRTSPGCGRADRTTGCPRRCRRLPDAARGAPGETRARSRAKRTISSCRWRSDQSTQLVSLSWQYALLLPRWRAAELVARRAASARPGRWRGSAGSS